MVLAHNINEGKRTQDVKITEDVTFDTMLLSPSTLAGLTNSGFHKPSPIQLHGIPLGKCGFDLLLEAKSGTGKTAVFTVIALEKLDLEKGLQTIILAPTREIAAQICDVIKQIGSSYKNLNVEVVIGGLPTQDDIAKFKKKVHMVVGSPGRLRHLIQANHMDVSAVRLFVLDEADKLMDKNFQADINYIFSVIPKEKQVIMSSATYPEMLISVMKKYVQNAQHICPDSTSILLGIKQLVVTVKCNSNIVRQTQNRFEELLKILSKKQFKQCLIFCNYQVRVRDLCKMLLREKWPAEQLYGQQEQTDRLDAIKTLQEYKCRILISTDLAARGIDASNVDLVVNFEPPYEWQTYLHRIGRAGRFGSFGIAISILSEGQEELKFKNMIKAINGSLNLRKLWDEENLESDEFYSLSETSIKQTNQNNDSYNNLRIKFTNEDESLNDTGSFETCVFFENPKEYKIESFSDLLTCFESHKMDNNNSASKKVDEESNSEYITPILNVQSDVTPKGKSNIELEDKFVPTSHEKNEELFCKIINNVAEEHLNTKNQTHINNNLKPGITLNKGLCDLEDGKTSDTEELSKTKTNHSKLLKNYNKVSINCTYNRKQSMNINDNEMYNFESDESRLNKTLLEAGLPTSFGSSKGRRKARKIHSENIQKTQESDGIKIMELECENVYLPVERKAHIQLESKEKSSLNCRKESCNRRNKKEQQNYYSQDHNHESYDQIVGQIHTHENTGYDIHTKYIAWYNQLKRNIQQVEMALYIDELSKM